MNIILNANYKPSIDQMAQEIWNMTDYEQAQLINKLAKISNYEDIRNQIYSIFQTNIVDEDVGWLIDTLYEYCRGE